MTKWRAALTLFSFFFVWEGERRGAPGVGDARTRRGGGGGAFTDALSTAMVMDWGGILISWWNDEQRSSLKLAVGSMFD